MTRDEVFQKVAKIYADLTGQPAASLKEGDALISGGAIDSFHLVDLALRVEEAFGVVVEDTELDGQTFDSAGSLVDLILARR